MEELRWTYQEMKENLITDYIRNVTKGEFTNHDWLVDQEREFDFLHENNRIDGYTKGALLRLVRRMTNHNMLIRWSCE